MGRTALARLLCVLGLCLAWPTLAHQGGTTAYAAISIAGNALRYQLTLSQWPAAFLTPLGGNLDTARTRLPPAVAAHLHFSNATEACAVANARLAGASADTLLKVSKEIAREIRGATPGGVRGLQALGFPLASKEIAQVSMNLHDLLEATDRGDTLHAIRERIRAAASSRGVQIGETEVVGLLPDRALHAGGDPAALQISGGWERVVLER